MNSSTATTLLLMIVCAMSGAQAEQPYPSRPVRIIVPFSPGGGTELQARVLAARLFENTGQTFVVDNKPGASGLIGAEATVNALPDGYTMLMSTATLAELAQTGEGTARHIVRPEKINLASGERRAWQKFEQSCLKFGYITQRVSARRIAVCGSRAA
jgi:tripartite-type tricarboxylate transporter receptor subunit TctC